VAGAERCSGKTQRYRMRMRIGVLVCALVLAAIPASAQQSVPAPVLTVLDFQPKGIAAAEARVFSDVLATHIVQSELYRVIDRQRRETLLEEIEFSYADCTDRNCQLEIGRLLSASQLVVGTIERGDRDLTVTVRRIDVAGGGTLGEAIRSYASLEALIDGTADLARICCGAEPRQIATRGPISARSLIAEDRREEFEAELRRLRKRVDPDRYSLWLSEKDFAEYESNAGVEEKIEFIEEYMRQANSRGHAVDMAIQYRPYSVRESQEYGRYDKMTGRSLGLSLAWSYQFNNWFSAGVNGSIAQQKHIEQFYDTDDTLLTEEEVVEFSFFLGPLFIIGDKTGSLALLISSGAFGGIGPLPLRLGIYFRNFYIGYFGSMSLEDGYAVHGAEIGYSLFLGRRRSWPASSGRLGAGR